MRFESTVPKRKKKHKLKNGVLISLTFLLVLTGLLLIFSPMIEQQLIVHRATKETATTAKQMKENQKAKVSYDNNTVQPASLTTLVENQIKNVSLPVIGLVSIPDLSVNLPIIKGDGYNTMLYGGGTMKPDEIMGQGNYAIASHHVSNVMGSRYDGILFSPLQRARIGQKVYLTDKVKVYVYQIDKILKVLPNQGEVILDVPGQQLVTLVTCYSDDTYRLIVQGKLIKTQVYDNTTAALFDQKFNQYWK
ncbi:class A sortase [Lactococcus allomyrinae]|uniref:Class A sortase n=1 Tax=Lactococcus allomyrinae TaxID=2419773 RepID=A0A387BFV6_9LACT|nr:class A sortase [Lactococcus allomyrinae]AYG01154.1 class A sortase [Lactococcus allomyrinae]